MLLGVVFGQNYKYDIHPYNLVFIRVSFLRIFIVSMQEIKNEGFTYFVSDDFVDRHSDDQIVDREGWLEYALQKKT